MGLDQYAYTTCQAENCDCAGTELFYWRKHNRLQGWMKKLYRAKGETEDFCFARMFLTLEDLDKLEKAIEEKSFPATRGFFYGDDSYSNINEDGDYEYIKSDKKFIKLAREAIRKNRRVYYTSNW